MMPHFPPSPEVRTHATRTRRTERRGMVAVIAAGFIAAALALAAHTHVFRLIGGQTICADPECLTPIAVLATPGCDTFCDGPCAYCDARDLALIPGDRHDRP